MSTQQYPFHLLHLDFETLSFYFTTHHIQLMRLLTERKLVLASLQHQLSKFFTRLIDCQSGRCKICTFCSLCANCVQTVQTGILEFCSAHVFLFFLSILHGTVCATHYTRCKNDARFDYAGIFLIPNLRHATAESHN